MPIFTIAATAIIGSLGISSAWIGITAPYIDDAIDEEPGARPDELIAEDESEDDPAS